MPEQTIIQHCSEEKVAFELYAYIYKLVYHTGRKSLSKEEHLELYKECLRAVKNAHK